MAIALLAMTTFGIRAKNRRLELGLSQVEVARLSGLSQTTISNIESGRNRTTGELIALSRALECAPEFLDEGVNSPRRGVKVGEEPARYEALREVPVIGNAIASATDGYFEQEGDGDVYVLFQTRDSKAYGIRVRGDSMRPRIRPGEIVVVEPHRECHPGDDVIVATTDGRKMIKQFLYRRSGTVALGSINENHPMLTLNENEILKMEYVAGILPPGAARDTLAIPDPDSP